MCGIWEAAVKSTKYHLRRVLGDASLTYEEMYTLLVEIEACLNSRPLIPLSNDKNDYQPLTPAHFLIGDSLASVPERNLENITSNRLDRYQRLRQLQQQFWKRWSRDYLSSLQQRSKWKSKVGCPINVDSLVLLVEDDAPPLRWHLARFVQIHVGNDNIVRVVSVRVPNGNVIKRSISRICPMPIEQMDGHVKSLEKPSLFNRRRNVSECFGNSARNSCDAQVTNRCEQTRSQL